MKRLAICIPTYNQPGMIEEMLIRCLGIYDAAGIDIYIYDSSPGKETESVVCQCREGHGNIFYSHLTADIHSNIKVLEAYKEIIGMGRYEYLWLCPDYIQLTEQGTECVLGHCGAGFDICVLNYRDVEHIGEKTYTDINAFFLDCAWHMSSYMATVIRVSSFAGIEWEGFYERYTCPNRINHSHVALYFEQLAKLQEVKAVHVPVTSTHLRVSSYRKDSLWRKEVFHIWCSCWPDMVRALPVQYRHKDEVIKKLGVNTGILGWANFKALRRDCIYDIGIYRQYRRMWGSLTNVPRVFLWMLAHIPARAVGLLRHPSLRRGLLRKRLSRFCSQHGDIFIYGCGFMAKKTSALLDGLHIGYRCYVVSDCSGEKQNFNGRPVIGYGQLPTAGSDCGIIIALNKENSRRLLEEKPEIGSYKIFCMYRYEDVL